jgi:large subunit ribosomal protein L24
MQRIKVGDTVLVIAGKDKGARGEVLRVDNKAGRVVVEAINVAKKHQKPMQAGRRTVQAGIIEFEAPIDRSNVMLVCPQCDKPTRVGIRLTAEGNRVRFCHECDQEID